MAVVPLTMKSAVPTPVTTESNRARNTNVSALVVSATGTLRVIVLRRGAVVSIRTVQPREKLLLLVLPPDVKLAIAVITRSPAPNGLVGVNEYVASPATITEGDWATPSMYTVTVAPGSATPVMVGVVSLVGVGVITDGVVTKVGTGNVQARIVEGPLSLPRVSTATT